MRRTAGLTLLELVAGMALGGLLAAAASVGVADLVAGARLAGAARTLGATLRLARGRALAGVGPVVARFDPAGGTYEVLDRLGTRLERHELPPGLVFRALPARARITFGALGTADNATIAIAVGSRTRRIVVNQRGRVRLS